MLTAKTADAHLLYEESVQSPEEEVDFIHQAFRRYNKRTALTLREDFCGTAILATEWAKSSKDRTAVGVDLEPSVLAWSKQHRLAPLDKSVSSRVKLVQADVRQKTKQRFDAICAYNYSWWVFHQRKDLLTYFKSVRASLVKDGIFFLDIMGGSTSQQTSLEPRNYRKYKYIWEQASYNPIDGHFTANIHFEFKDGSRLKRAFHYDWRLWHITEARDVLMDAGFKHVDIYWEDVDKNGEANGNFRPQTVVENEPTWNAYILAR
jgi:cyclopropane fatty-acyl-phospholipid synthase-like methyltransferase